MSIFQSAQAGGALITEVRGTWQAKPIPLSFGEYDLQGNKQFRRFAMRLLESLFYLHSASVATLIFQS